VALVCDGLQTLNNQTVLEIKSYRDSGINSEKQQFNIQQLIGRQVTGVLRHGKLFAIEFNDLLLELHLRMTGRILIEDNKTGLQLNSESHLDKKHLLLEISFTDCKMFFYDPRRFATIRIIEKQFFANNLGPDLWDQDLNTELVVNSKRASKAVILDQQVIAGIGNYLADEGLWYSTINPKEPWNSLTNEQRKKLITSITDISKQAYQLGGVSIRDYLDSKGNKGQMQYQLQCYGRKNLPCFNCGQLLASTRVAGRGTTYCLKCQSLKQ
jgi:formamidopyrimidine-DNA glycosylase